MITLEEAAHLEEVGRRKIFRLLSAMTIFPKPVGSILVYFNCILDGSPSKIIFRASIKTKW